MVESIDFSEPCADINDWSCVLEKNVGEDFGEFGDV